MNIILGLFSKKGILAVFVLIGLEYTCFPLPSEFILPFIGSIASVRGYSVIGVILLSVIFSYFGCLICYLVGYYGGVYLYDKIYKKFRKGQKGLDFAKEKFEKYGGVSVFLCRLVPLCRTYISFFAGIFKQSLFTYSFYSIIGIFLWNTTLIVSGYLLANKWNIIGDYYNKYKIIVFFLFLIIIFLIFFCIMYKKVKNDKTINGD